MTHTHRQIQRRGRQESHKEVSTLREQLITSLEQTGTFFVEFDRTRNLLMKLSTFLTQTENRFQDLQEAYDTLNQDFLQVQQERDLLQTNSQA
ncbi:6799_t:CDS:2 [Funneliformis geosporum]|uniref:6799_t:CDS:1 n=1 Tax=Funneliformis geosporum TaxID=1117311 RepID=A0A9W4WY00_9GLOM|nr:6799_t:CDS:2 [Funneliformis geosporum]